MVGGQIHVIFKWTKTNAPHRTYKVRFQTFPNTPCMPLSQKTWGSSEIVQEAQGWMRKNSVAWSFLACICHRTLVPSTNGHVYIQPMIEKTGNQDLVLYLHVPNSNCRRYNSNLPATRSSLADSTGIDNLYGQPIGPNQLTPSQYL